MEERLLNLYCEVLSDLLIGYPFDNDKIEEMLWMIHKMHFVNFSLDSKATLKILERYV